MTFGEIVSGIMALDPQEQEDQILSLVAGLSIASNAYGLHDMCARNGTRLGGGVYLDTDREAFKDASDRARRTLDSVIGQTIGLKT